MSEYRKWCILFGAICIVVFHLGGFLFGWMVEPAYYVEVKAYFDDGLDNVRSVIAGNTFNKNYKSPEIPVKIVSSNKEGAHVIFTVNDRYEYDTENYTEAVLGYSPIIAVFPSEYSLSSKDYEEPSFSVMGNSSSYWYTYDMKKILDAAISSEDGTINLANLGFRDAKKDLEAVKLSIPDRMYSFRQDVINSLAYILLDGRDATNQTILEEVRTQLYQIIDKSDTLTSMSSLNSIKDNKNRIYLVPEYFLSQINKGNGFKPVYWKDPYAVKLRMIYPTKAEGLEQESYDASINELIKILQNNNDIGNKYIRNNKPIIDIIFTYFIVNLILLSLIHY